MTESHTRSNAKESHTRTVEELPEDSYRIVDPYQAGAFVRNLSEVKSAPWINQRLENNAEVVVGAYTDHVGYKAVVGTEDSLEEFKISKEVYQDLEEQNWI